MTQVRELRPDDTEQLLQLVNAHLSAIVPGWALSEDYLLSRLERDPSEFVVDPWVKERKTFVGIVNERVCAAVHVATYREETNFGDRGDVKWVICWPDHVDAGVDALEAACAYLDDAKVSEISIGGDLFAPLLTGVPDCWPHVQEIARRAGFSLRESRMESVYAGAVPQGQPGAPPLNELIVQRTVGRMGVKFAAVYVGEILAECECKTDLTLGGRLPAFSGWAEISEVETLPDWRNRGIGTWLMRHACEWLRFAGITRVALGVDEGDERAGAGRYYQRFGWEPITRMEIGWSRAGKNRRI